MRIKMHHGNTSVGRVDELRRNIRRRAATSVFVYNTGRIGCSASSSAISKKLDKFTCTLIEITWDLLLSSFSQAYVLFHHIF